MSNDKMMRDLIGGLIACDDQPPAECLTELRESLGRKVAGMKTKGRYAGRVLMAGLAGAALGLALILAANSPFQGALWLLRAGFCVLIAGVVVFFIGAMSRASSLGIGYVWARHDLHDAAIMELSLQVQRLTQRIDALEKQNSQAP